MKTINTDSRSKKRIRFASSKERSKKASADVYRSYKNRIGGGVTSAATRESFVHNPRDQVRAKKRHKLNRSQSTTGKKSDDLTAFVKLTDEPTRQKGSDDGEFDVNSIKNNDEEQLGTSTNFSSEIDVAFDRNASEIFSKFHREIWVLIRSLPEILHNLDKIIDLLMAYMLSPASKPETPTPVDSFPATSDREEFVINHATTDILHLLSVLARDLRHEIDPYLHTKILPRVLQDLLNPPPPPPESKKQPIPLDVTIVETAFRTLSYIFRYNSNMIVNGMESMRKYYGITLGHRRELIRRLSAETFAPQIRKMKSQSAREQHIRRVLRALSSTESQPVSKALQRIQEDAIDGISTLLFQLMKGVPGKFHSQGGRILKFMLDYSCRQHNQKADGNSDDLVHNVASSVLDKLMFHFNGSGFVAVCIELFSLLAVSVEKHSKLSVGNSEKPESTFQSVIKNLKLIVQIGTKRSGKFLRMCSDEELQVLYGSISKLCKGGLLDPLELSDRCALISLLCQIWLPLQDRDFVNLEGNIRKALESQKKNIESVHSLSLIFAKDLVPHLEHSDTRSQITSILIATSALMAKSNPTASVEVTFAIISSQSKLPSDENKPDKIESRKQFELFDLVDIRDLSISEKDQKILLDACLLGLEDKHEESFCAQLGLNIRCAPFLALLGDKIDIEMYDRVAEWLIECFDISWRADLSDSHIIKGLAIEAFSYLTLKVAESSIPSSVAKKNVTRFKKLARNLLTECNGSLWAMRGLASFIPVLESFRLGLLLEDCDDAFDLLMPHLRSSNHFLRLYTLQILASYPQKMFVVDHADLDLEDDLDEEKDSYPPTENKENKNGPVGQCDLMKVLLELELSPIKLEDERQICALIGKVEILARTRRLPAVYAEAAANHMLGIFNVKFAPVWQSTEKALLSLLIAHEEIVWPSFETELVNVITGSVRVNKFPTELSEDMDTIFKEKHLHACRRWGDSNGKDISLFENSVSIIEGEVPCYHTTDAETLMESVWKVAEQGHRVVVKHSRGIVPLFLRFLHEQYFAFHSNDQDARELNLHEFVEEGT